MKSLQMASILTLVGSLIIINSCNNANNKNDYLRKVLGNLEKIKSASYFSTASTNIPGDTLVALNISVHTVEYFNPADTFMGSSFAETQQMDNIKLDIFYDGKAVTYLDWNEKTITIDSFKTHSSDYRGKAPFFNYTKSIIKYALETHDSISTDLKDFGDSLLFRLVIYADKQVVFSGKPYYIDDPNSQGDKVSRYDIWINKSDDLPYKYRNSTSWQTCKNVEFNKDKIEDFIVSKKFPSDFTITIRGQEKPVKSDLLGKVAPAWVLNDTNNNSIALEELKSKVLIIQFTGIGCGPCHASIPFLKQLVTDYREKDFEFVSIETWSKNIAVIKRYYNNNDLNYKFLMSTDDVTKNYQVNAVPVFYILDKNRVIRKIIRGYGIGATDEEIKDAINELI